MASDKFNMNIKTDFNEVYKALDETKQRTVKSAASAALNRAVTSAKAEALRQIQANRALPATQARKELSLQRASSQNLIASLLISYSPISLAHFRVHNTRRGQGPISVQTLPDKGYTPIKGAWVKQNAGGTVVFQRIGKGLHDIKKLYGPSLPSVIKKEGVADKIKAVTDESWTKNFLSQLEYRLGKLGFHVSKH